MTTPLRSSVQKVQDALKALGFSIQVVELQATTRTSAEAADAVGCKVEQIAKSLVFQAKISHRPILVIASGLNRVNEEKIAGLISEPISKADGEMGSVQEFMKTFPSVSPGLGLRTAVTKLTKRQKGMTTQ